MIPIWTVLVLWTCMGLLILNIVETNGVDGIVYITLFLLACGPIGWLCIIFSCIQIIYYIVTGKW